VYRLRTTKNAGYGVRVQRLDRYVLREFVPVFLTAFMVVTGVLLLGRLLGLVTLVLHNRFAWSTALRFLAYTLPTLSGFTLPVAFLLGCALTFNRLATDSEYIALQAAGISLYRLVAPLAGVAVGLFLLTSLIHCYVTPWGFQGLRQLFFEVARQQTLVLLRPGEFQDLFRHFTVYVARTQPETQRLEGIFIADERQAVPQVITARAGEVHVHDATLHVLLRLEDGRIHRLLPAGSRYQIFRFDRYDVRLALHSRLARQVRGATRPRELFPAQLRAAMQQASGPWARRLRFVWHKRFALPFACIVFAGLGPSLGVVQTRSGRSGGYILGMGALFVYYLLFSASNALGEETTWPLLLIAWFPNVLMGGVAWWLLRRTAHTMPEWNLVASLTWLTQRRRRRGHTSHWARRS
jgi:lipopolysaccharide export system permease protein